MRNMESLKELNQMLHTGATAHQVTTASQAVGLAGISLLVRPSGGSFLADALLFQGWYLP